MSWRALAAAFALWCATNAQAQPQVQSAYIAGADGTLLAADIWREAQADEVSVQRLPAIVQFTRYWRSFRGADMNIDQTQLVRFFTSAGYAVVVVDVRGTGASFGARETEFSDEEVADFAAVFDWVVAQSWSNGRLATLGSSYLGNTAELAAITRHPALRAVVPRFSDFSEYRHAVRPGGVRNTVIASVWPALVGALDRNDPCGAFAGVAGRDCAPQAPWIGGVRPVNGDDARLSAAVTEHRGNANLDRILAQLLYSDDSFHRAGLQNVTLDSVSPAGRWRHIDDARVPSYHWASWFDGGTAEGVLSRFAVYRSPVKAIIGAWTHGGGALADPFGADQGGPPTPSVQAQLSDIQAFLDPLLKSDAGVERDGKSMLRYFVLGENAWRTTDRWPPSGVRMRRWHFSAGGVLSDRSRDPAGVDRYEVDFAASTGRTNRWHTQLGEPVIYPDRASQDRRLLTYTSAPMTEAAEITGTPMAHIVLAPSQSDGALFVYLEDVAPDGRVTYLSEGVLRLTFQGPIDQRSALLARKPAHTYARNEAKVVVPGRDIELALSLHPISVLIREGHRLRIAIAGSDADTFERLPSNAAPLSLLVRRPGSYVDLPTLERRGRQADSAPLVFQ